MVEVKRFTHTTIRIKSKDTIIYIDPYKIENDDKADYIFCCHDHFDHLSIEDIKKLLKKTTKIFVPTSVMPKVLEFTENETTSFNLGEKLIFKEFSVEIVPAYNTNKEFHKKNTDWCGFIFTIEKKRIYYAGDTDVIPEMNLITDINLAILPVSGVYVMDAEEAANATAIIQPKMAMPAHYGPIVGTEKDAETFKNKAHCDVVIDEVEL